MAGLDGLGSMPGRVVQLVVGDVAGDAVGDVEHAVLITECRQKLPLRVDQVAGMRDLIILRASSLQVNSQQ